MKNAHLGFYLRLFFICLPIGVLAQNPGGVSTNLLTWWKADAGLTGSSPVTAWNDQSGNAYNLSATSGPTLVTNDINYNDALSFNGSSQYMQVTNGIFGTSTYNDMFTFIVNKTTNVQNSSIFFESLSSGDRYGSHVVWGDENVYYDLGLCCTSSRINVNWGTSTGQYYLWTMTTSTGTSTPSGTRKAIYRDGLAITTNNQNDNGTGTNNNFYLASSNGSSSFHSGSIAEIVIYNGVPSSTEFQQIHSYLGIKYGITIDQSTPTAYLNSAGSSIYASGSGGTHDSYDNDIAGIGRDDNSGLDQQISKSINADAFIIMDKGGAFGSTGDFIVWGNDGATISLTASNAHPSYTNRVRRIWRADLSGTPGTVSVRFLLGGSVPNTGSAADYAILIDGTDTDFSSGATAHTTGASLSGDTITFTGVSFTDGDYFTLGTNASSIGPGGYSSNLLGWWKANDGVTGSTPVTQWNDQTSAANHLLAGTGPDLLSNDINFNPSMNFNGTNEYLQVTGGILGTTTYEDMFVYIINKGTTVQSSSVFREALSGGDRFGSHLVWNNSQVYYDYGTCCGSGRINGAWGTTTGVYHLWTMGASTSTSTPSGTNKSIYRDGNLIHSNNNSDNGTGNNSNFYVGSSNGSGSFHAGDVAELAIFATTPTTSQLHQIHTYFALKYGLSLPHNYIDGQGDTLWDIVGNASYSNDLSGIGREDAQELNQKQSKSENSDAILTVALGSVAADNASNANSFGTDRSFLMWGNDDGALDGTGVTDYPLSVSSRIARVWLASESGTLGTVRLQFDASGLPGPSGAGTNDLADIRLLIDADGTFASGATVVSPTSFDNSTDIVEFDVDFNSSDGFFFTLASVDLINAPLPIELLSFDVRTLSNQSVSVSWETASEINNDYFTVERSADGLLWEEVAQINGAGNSYSRLSYFYTDQNPLNGTSYYRLKQTDFDGTYTYSPIHSVHFDEENASLLIYPNPTEGRIVVKGNPTKLNHLRLFDVRGLDLTSRIRMQLDAEEGQAVLDLSTLDKGYYFLQSQSKTYKVYKL